MNWKLVDGPGGTGDASAAWWYEIERDGQRRSVLIESRVSVDDEVVVDSEKVKRAIETCGRSAVEDILTEDDPPTELYITVYGVARYLTTIPRPGWLEVVTCQRAIPGKFERGGAVVGQRAGMSPSKWTDQ